MFTKTVKTFANACIDSGGGGDYVIGIEGLEEQVSRKVAEHTAVDRTKIEGCCEKS